MKQPINEQPTAAEKEMGKRYQVLASRFPNGHKCDWTWNYNTKKEAMRKITRLRRKGYAVYHLWDTLDNPLSNLFQI